MLRIVAGHLGKMGLTFAVIDGTVNPKRRMDLVEEFNTNPKGPQVYGLFLHTDFSLIVWFVVCLLMCLFVRNQEGVHCWP